MELETLFTASKWDIIKLLSEKDQSPLELANATRTSMANISQQLRLLEMAGLVSSKRISNRDKDKPRIIYSLNKNSAYIINAMEGFAKKKLLNLSEKNKISLKIWFFKDPETNYLVEKVFWQLEPYLEHINKISVDSSSSKIKFFIKADKKTETELKNLKFRSYKPVEVVFQDENIGYLLHSRA